MPVSTKDNKIVVTVPAEMKEQFKKLADDEGRSLSNYVIQVLKKHIEQMQKEGRISRKEGKLPDQLIAENDNIINKKD